MSLIQKVLINVFSNWAALLVNLIISFFLAPFVVNKLGSTYYGIWVIMMQLTGYLYLLDFGIRESVIRFVSKYRAESDLAAIDRVISSAVSLYLVICLICVVVAAVFSFVFPHTFKVAPEAVQTARFVVMITGINLGQFFVFNVFTGVLMGIQRYDISNKISILFSLLRVFLIVYFLKSGYGIIALALIQLGINLGSNIVQFHIARKLLPFRLRLRSPFGQDKKVVKKLVNYSFFVLIINICQKVIFYTDAMVIGIFLPTAAITYYAIAGNLIEYLRRFVVTMASVLNPLTSELESRHENQKITTVLIQGTKFSLLIGLPICAVYYTMGRQFIKLWMGPEFADPAYSVLAILAVTHLFSLPHFTVSSILYGMSRHQVIAYSKVFEALFNLALSIILVKPFGIVGVALGTAIPHLISVVFVFPVMITRKLEIPISRYLMESYVGPLFSGIPFLGICFIANRYYPAENLLVFFIQIALMLPTYLLPDWLLSFSKEEKKWYLSLVIPRLTAITKR